MHEGPRRVGKEAEAEKRGPASEGGRRKPRRVGAGLVSRSFGGWDE